MRTVLPSGRRVSRNSRMLSSTTRRGLTPHFTQIGVADVAWGNLWGKGKKVKFALEQAMKALSGNRGIALLFL